MEPIQVIVIERTFQGGVMVEPGAKLWFDPTPRAGEKASKLTADGKARKLPRWAVLPGDARLNKPKPVAGDLKPKAAQAAVKAKAGALTGSTESA